MPRRRIATAFLVCSALAVVAVWRFGYHGLDPRLIFWPPSDDELAAPAALEEPAELNVKEMPLPGRQLLRGPVSR